MVNRNARTFYEENGDVGTLRSQQREYANNWSGTLAANMWADAMWADATQTGSQQWSIVDFFSSNY